jgi:hypothetical protein
MFTKTKMALAAALVLGSASLALADGYEDQAADAMRNFGPVQAQQGQLTTRQVALPKTSAPSAGTERWLDRASQNVDGGGN